MFKKGMFLLCVLTAALILLPLAAVVEAADIPLSGLSIESGNWDRVGQTLSMRAVKEPSNANGTFEYSWTCDNPRWEISKVTNGPEWASARVDYDLSKSTTTITLTVTQTLPSGRIVAKQFLRSYTFDAYAGLDDPTMGCNAGLGLFAAVFMGLAVLHKRRR